MKTKLFLGLSFCVLIQLSHAEPSWTFKLPIQQLNAQYTVDLKAGPYLVLTKIPEKGSFDPWEGFVVNGSFKQYQILVLSYTDAWYTKPWYASPKVTIQSDGSFKFDVMTGDGDPENATKVSIHLVPNDLEIPIATGLHDIPNSITDQSVFSMIIPR